MSKTKRRDAKKFAAERVRRKRNAPSSKRSIGKGRIVILDIETRPATLELCPISGLPEFIFSGHVKGID